MQPRARVFVSTLLCRDVTPWSDEQLALTVVNRLQVDLHEEQELQAHITFTHSPPEATPDFRARSHLVDQHGKMIVGTELIHGDGKIRLGGNNSITLVLTLRFTPTYFGYYWLETDVSGSVKARTPLQVEPK